jgi:hypothetical protein
VRRRTCRREGWWPARAPESQACFSGSAGIRLAAIRCDRESASASRLGLGQSARPLGLRWRQARGGSPGSEFAVAGLGICLPS